MKKIGIITLNGNTNFGNRLQNYALQEYLKIFDFKVETIWFCSFSNFIKEKIKKYIFYFCDKRKYYFLKFSNQYIATKYYINKNIGNKYDYFVAGSDQIWNYTFHTFDSTMFLNFSPKEKNLSYAASFGVDSIPDNYKNKFIEGINNFNYLSVREEQGKKIICDLINKDVAEVLIDPTMLLTADEWDKISKKPQKMNNQKYILTYFLGNLSNNKLAEINKVAKENDCIVINILDKNSEFYDCGPAEFLYLEKNAFLICTDSFHSSVFAIIYNRPFIIFDREDSELKMNSRIDTLLNTLDIKNRRFSSKITKENLKHNYDNAYKILEEERKKSRLFLEKSLKIKGCEKNERK